MTEHEQKLQAAHRRYLDAAHAMQSGVAFTLDHDPRERDPKHLRTGVNSALVSVSALAEFLAEKGIIDRLEWYEALADAMERERDDYRARIEDRFPDANVTLA